MLKRVLFVVTIVFFFPSTRASHDENLHRILKSTIKFFDKLKLHYESQVPSPDLYESIDREINEYVNKVKISSILSREKRQLDLDKGVRILKGFETLTDLDLSKAVDVTFFVYRDGSELRWYVAALNFSGISLHQYKHRTFSQVGSFGLTNGTQIISHTSDVATLLIVQRSIGDALVVRLTQNDAHKMLHKVQTVDTPAATDLTVWQGLKKIYFAVSSPNNITVFVWLGEHFDHIQTIKFGATRIVPFRTGGAMHLLAIGLSRTSILKFLLRLGEFVVLQRLSGAADATHFQMDKARHGEYFLALAGQTSTIVYKESKHRFVPFQKISAAESITSMHDESAILLFLIENGKMKILQYDGWRFVELGVHGSGISDARPITYGDEHFLAFRRRKPAAEGRDDQTAIKETNAPSKLNSDESLESSERINSNNTFHEPNNQYFEENSLKPNGWWEFRKIVWGRKESWSSLRERTKIWCQDTLKKIAAVPVILPKLKDPLRIERGHIKTIRASEVNGQNAEKFVHLTERLDAIVSKSKEQEKSLKRYISTINPVFKNLRAFNVRANCTKMCRAKNIKTTEAADFLHNVRWMDNASENFNFHKVKVSYAKKMPCPYPAPKFQDVTVDGLVNGIPFPAFVHDVLKITGDQHLTGSLTFSELRVSNAEAPLDIASNFTHQEILAIDIETNELNITSGNFLLPLHNDESSTMSGSLEIKKAKLEGKIQLRGKVNGTGSAEFSPTIQISEPIELFRDFSLENVGVIESLEVEDVSRSSGKSFKEIISKALPLDAEHVPVHFKLRNDNVSWTNVTVRNFPYKWLMKNHSGQIVISGHKNATKTNITMGNSPYKNLPMPRLQVRLCSIAAISPDIWESKLVIDHGRAATVKAINLYNDSDLSKIFLDSVRSLEEIPWRLKNLTGQMTVKVSKIKEIDGMDYTGWKNTMARWVEPGRLKGPVIIQNLKVSELIVTNSFLMPLPDQVGNVEIKGNLYVGTLNKINIDEFMRDTVKIDDNLSMTNVTFAGGIAVEQILASNTSFSLQENLSSGYLGSKEILGTLECEEIIVSNFIHQPSPDKPVNIVVKGNAQFMKQPEIINVNNKNVGSLYNEVWLTDRPNNISAKFIEFKNFTVDSDMKILKSFNTPNLGPWSGLEDRLLSKARPQVINVDAWFKSIKAPNIVASMKSHLRSNISYLYDLEFNSLKNTKDSPVITNNWNFEEIIVTGDCDIQGPINGLNLATDVVRTDVEKNVITGKKIFSDLKAQNIDGLNFDKLARKALKKNNGNRTVIIKGAKTFKTVEIKNMRMDGTIMGRRIENWFLKSVGQNLQGTKVFQGSVTAPAIITDGLVNNIHLEYFIEYQLKKRAPLQIIKTPILLAKNLTILGNITIDGLYNGVELKNFEHVNNSMESVAVKTSELMNFAEGIQLALANRAIYWNKLELVDEYLKPAFFDPPKIEQFQFDGLGRCGIIGLYLCCGDGRFLYPLPTVLMTNQIYQAKVINLSGIPLIATVNLDPGGGIFIWRYNLDQQKFHALAGLHVPGIIEGSLTTMMDSLWISLRLPDDTMVLRYQLWSGFQGWIIPGDGPFLMSSTPTNELLIFRFDGVYKLGGLGGPRHIFHAELNGQIDTFTVGTDYYVQMTDKNVTKLFKTRYIGV